MFTGWEGVECHNYSPLIYARDCQDIAVTGEGIFEGNGDAWWYWKKRQDEAVGALYDAQRNDIPSSQRVFGIAEALRPQFLQPIRCKNVLVEGATFRNGYSGLCTGLL